jgi:murein DD-endopeptidase MepM/ murein hydrolase activator NlpD
LISERRRELISLDMDKKQNISIVHSLQNKEVELKNEINKRERIQAEIEKEIHKIIEEEAAKAREAKKSNKLSTEEKIISSDFEKNVGRLPWPSEQGILIGKYGEQNHPVLKGIKIRSNGIDINTVEGANVRSVFDGEVTKVIAILGANYTVIIKHGIFRTVYQNLIDVRVKAGDKVKTKTIIGTVFTDRDNISRFHFEVWRDKITQNPELWLSK